jgi:hypothetical protein
MQCVEAMPLPTCDLACEGGCVVWGVHTAGCWVAGIGVTALGVD